MYVWLVVGIVVLLGLLHQLTYLRRRQVEEFLTIDPQAAKAQRQMLQFEGERRFNDFARSQNPNVMLPSDQVDEALRQVAPVSTSRSSSLLSLLAHTNFGATDDGSGKQGASVEQTGMVQQKINFCESLTAVNCDLLSDPRLAECGFCHRDGVNSKGKAHRGGMFISSDDQIRANEVAMASGKNVAAAYKPTIGTCKPQNFTLMKENCQARELQVQCQAAAVPTASNPCGQCYGGAAIGSTGLLYMGPKPRTYTATLHVSHPGSHGAAGLTVKLPDGTIASLAASDKPLLDPQQLTIDVKEGDSLTITVAGPPAFWCGWLSNADGSRTVSIDIGVSSIVPAGGFMIAGDKRGAALGAAMASSPLWNNFQAQVPNTVLWYQRRSEGIPGSIVSAWYGLSNGSQGVDVTGYLKLAAGSGSDVTVDPAALNIADPAPGAPKHLWITQDSGNTLIFKDGDVIKGAQLFNTMTVNFTVPATLVDPMFSADKESCASGPLVLTEIGAGLMGAHSCFAADGSFKPSMYCIRELYAAAGGRTQGQIYQKYLQSDEAAAKLASQSGGSLDATVAALNNGVNIALYGVDSNGAPQDFETVKQYALDYLGVTMNNPCDGPAAASGPHSAECLDYLWRTSGNTGQDSRTNIDPKKLPYAYCSATGAGAPLNADGTVNQSNMTAANGLGSISSVRTYFQGIFNRTKDSSDFDKQAAAMRDCYGVSLKPPVADEAECPPPNAGDWQCFGPSKLQQPEVFQVNGGPANNVAYIGQQLYQYKQSDAASVCAAVGATVATTAQLTAAQAQGADWCSAGWVADSTTPAYPITTSVVTGCAAAPGVQQFLPSSGLAAVNCFGKKPAPNTPGVYIFGPLGNKWYSPTSMPQGISDKSVIIGKEVNGRVYCGGSDNQNCLFFDSEGECEQHLKNKKPIPGAVYLTGWDSDVDIDRYVRTRA